MYLPCFVSVEIIGSLWLGLSCTNWIFSQSCTSSVICWDEMTCSLISLVEVPSCRASQTFLDFLVEILNKCGARSFDACPRSHSFVISHTCLTKFIEFFWEMIWKREKNQKLVLFTFEKLFGIKINFHKSWFFFLLFGDSKDLSYDFFELVGCKEGNFLFRYLGIPMHYVKLGIRIGC